MFRTEGSPTMLEVSTLNKEMEKLCQWLVSKRELLDSNIKLNNKCKRIYVHTLWSSRGGSRSTRLDSSTDQVGGTVQ